MATEGVVAPVDVPVTGVTRKLNCVKELWRRYLLVEPLLILFSAPNVLRLDYSATQTACQWPMGYDEYSCSYLTSRTSWPVYHYDVCKTVHQDDKVYIYSSKIAFAIPYIILMFAGGWADRYNKRKAFMFIPILGRCLYYKYRFLFSIIIESQPLILSCYSSMLPALFGDSPCFMMSVLSYITTTTPENDRVLRLSIFAVFVLLTNNLNLMIEPNDYFAYPITCAIFLAFEIAAILYVIFLIKEPKSNESVSQSNDMHLTNMGDIPIEENVTNIALSSEPPRRNIFREFFDPMLVLELIKLPYKRCDIYGSLILLLLILCYCLSVGQIDVETKYFNDHDNIAFRLMRFESYITGALLCGLVFSKTWKFSNSIIGIWISVFTAVSRLVYNFAPTTEITTTHYFGGVLDLFAVLRLVPIQSKASTINEGYGKLFSFFGILEPIAIFIYQPIYDAVVFASIESFPNFLLLNIELFYVPNVLIFIACYFLMHRRNSNMAQHNSTENL